MTSLSELNFVDLLPSSITGDEQFQAIASVIGEQLRNVAASIPAIEIYSRIDELDEPLISLLAWQFHVDHWDPDWAIETKREAVQDSIKLHKKKGTPWAVERAVEIATGKTAEVSEWFDYGGDPYRFRVSLNGSAMTVDDYDKAAVAIDSAKNVRSHLDFIQIPRTAAVNLQLAALPRMGITIGGRLPSDVSVSPATVRLASHQRYRLRIGAKLPAPVMGDIPVDLQVAAILRIGITIGGRLPSDVSVSPATVRLASCQRYRLRIRVKLSAYN